jgi:hypothetical protein
VDPEPLMTGDRGGRVGVEATAQKHNGGAHPDPLFP